MQTYHTDKWGKEVKSGKAGSFSLQMRCLLYSMMKNNDDPNLEYSDRSHNYNTVTVSVTVCVEMIAAR